MSLLVDRIDPAPPKRIYRWDLDKTYLQTEFDTFRQLVRTALQKAHEKRAVPGAATLIRELCAQGDARVAIISGSPRQMRAVLEEKLKLDGVVFDELILKDNVGNLLRGRFKALKGQVGYKLPALLESRGRGPVEAEEVLFGDDAEADAFIYSLYADLVAGRVDERVLIQVLDRANVYPDERARVLAAWKSLPTADPVKRIFINLDRLTPPAYFRRYGPRVVPIFNYFQAALVLMSDGHLTAQQVARVAADLVQDAGYNLLTLANSFQDLLRRGIQLQQVGDALADALTDTLNAPQKLAVLMRPGAEILGAFRRRLAALGNQPPPAPAAAVDYLALMTDALPRTHRKRKEPSADG